MSRNATLRICLRPEVRGLWQLTDMWDASKPVCIALSSTLLRAFMLRGCSWLGLCGRESRSLPDGVMNLHANCSASRPVAAQLRVSETLIPHSRTKPESTGETGVTICEWIVEC